MICFSQLLLFCNISSPHHFFLPLCPQRPLPTYFCIMIPLVVASHMQFCQWLHRSSWVKSPGLLQPDGFNTCEVRRTWPTRVREKQKKARVSRISNSNWWDQKGSKSREDMKFSRETIFFPPANYLSASNMIYKNWWKNRDYLAQLYLGQKKVLGWTES